MRKLLFFVLSLLIVLSGVALAVPWISTPPTTTEMTSYALTIDGGAPIPILAHKNQDETYIGAFDIGTLDPPLSNGNHNLTIQGFNTLWGLETNIHPFDVDKPADLAVISNVEVTATDPMK